MCGFTSNFYWRSMKFRSNPFCLKFWLFFLSGLILSCGEEDETEVGGRGKGGFGKGNWGGAKGEVAAIPVKADSVLRGSMNSFIETYARLEAEREIKVMARATGFLTELLAEEGDWVKNGQVLVRLDKEELGLRLRQVKGDYNEAESNYKRIKVLHEKKMVSQSEFDVALLRYENSKLNLAEAELNFSHTDVKAPITGVVLLRMVELGALVGSGKELFTIADMDPLLAKIHVPERRMFQLHAGQKAMVSVEALPEQSFKGSIRMISPMVEPESGTVKVTLEIPANSMLKPGMFCTVRIITDSRLNTLIIPKKALVLETDIDDVYVVSDGKAQLVEVVTGYVEGDRVEILSGVDEGMRVITVGHEGLKDGSPVRIVGDQVMGAVFSDGGSSTEGVERWSGSGHGFADKPRGASKWSQRGKTPGGGLPDSLRKLIQKYRSEGRELPDNIKDKLKKMRAEGPRR
ncbi:MAG: hypothetical protein CME10_14520 [Gemmatimonadetes bacterium]|nr:hypothetical protein [Gemmatimonadota bacterium]